MATKTGANTERGLRAQRLRSSDPTVPTPRRKKSRTDSRLVVETDDGGHLELTTDDVRVASGDTPHATQALGGVTADTRFDAEETGGGGHEGLEQAGQAESTEQHDESDDETLDSNEDTGEGRARGQQESSTPRTTPQPPPAPRQPSPAARAAAPPQH
jgi:hypothetical protein